MSTATRPTSPTVRPVEDEIDVFGLTDGGRVRTRNEDQFLIASLHRTMRVHGTSLPAEALGPLASGSRGWLLLVADGLGGEADGDQASERALTSIARYATHTLKYCHSADQAEQREFLTQLQRTVLLVHEQIKASGTGMATTLTMVVVMWPHAYLVHVGDSRCYRLRDGRLELLTLDQTMAQALYEAGALRAEDVSTSRLRHVLVSALGGDAATPLAAPIDCAWDDVVLLCTDGLTRHVTDDEIADHLRAAVSAEETCRSLVALALERGGRDNITVVNGRLRARRTP
jgi:protein phosphatase